MEQVLEGVALAHPHLVEPLIHMGPGHPGHHGRVVGAVVRQHEHVHQFGGIVLRLDAVDQVADDGLLVAGGDEDGDAVGRRLAVGRVLFPPRHGNIEELIGIAEEKRQHNGEIDDL